MPEEPVYTPAEAADILRVKERCVRDLIRAGKLKARRLGGSADSPRKLRVTASDLRAFQEAMPDYVPAK